MKINKKLYWWTAPGVLLILCLISTYSFSQTEGKIEQTGEVSINPEGQSESVTGDVIAEEKLVAEEEVFPEAPAEVPLEVSTEDLEFDVPEDLEFIEMEEVSQESQEAAQSGIVNLTFKEANVTDVLAALAQQTGMNIIWGNEVTGVITLRLEDVPWEQALDMVLKANKLSYEREGNVIRVTTIARLNEEKEALLKLAAAEKEKEPLVTEVMVLSFSDAMEVKNSLAKVLSTRGNIVVDERTNSLVITEIPSNFPELKKIAEKIDTRTPQVMIEARIVETSATLVRQLGIHWAIDGTKLVPTHYKGSALDDIVNKLIDPTTGKTVDGMTPAEKKAEIDHKGGEFTSHFLKESDLYDDDGNLKQYAGVFKLGVLDAYGFEIAWQALDALADTKILSNPRVATLHNREAYILVGEKVPIQKSEVTDTGTDYTIEFEDVGTTLKVTAKINQDDMVNLKITPEVSEIGEWRQLTAGEYPIIKTKKAEVEVLVKSGDTVVIGGLIYEKEIDSNYKIPLLGDIPVLGWVFKRKTIDKEQKEILVFVTPTVFGKDEKEEMAKQLMDFEGNNTVELIEKTAAKADEEIKVFEEIEQELKEMEKEEEFGKGEGKPSPAIKGPEEELTIELPGEQQPPVVEKKEPEEQLEIAAPKF